MDIDANLVIIGCFHDSRGQTRLRVGREDRSSVSAGVVATRTELIELAVLAWAGAADDERWAAIDDSSDSVDDGVEPAWG